MLSMCSRFISELLIRQSLCLGERNALARALGLSLFLLLSSIFPGSVLAGSVPLQHDPSDHQDYLDVKKDYLLSIQAECIRRSKDPAETKQAFLKLHNQYLDVSLHNIKRHNWTQLQRKAEAFLKLEPKEPFSKIVAGQILLESKRTINIVDNCRMIRTAAGKMRRYSLEARLYAAKATHAVYNEADFKDRKKRDASVARHLDLLVEWMSQKDSPEHLQRLMFEGGREFINSRFTRLSGKLPEFVEKVKAADGEMKPWLRSMLLGESYYELGWHARGHGYADTVDQDGWNQFEKNLQLAEQELKTAHGLHPERPEAATAMIGIAMAGDTNEDERTWFDRAVQAEFDYIPAYQKYRNSLLPQWGGSYEAMVDFGRECAATKRYDTPVPMEMYETFVRVYGHAKSRMGDRSTPQEFSDFLSKLDIDPQVQEVCDNYEKHIKQTDGFSISDARYYRGRSFAIAYQLGKLEDAFELVQKYRGDVTSDLSGQEIKTSSNLAIAYLYAANGAAADEVQSIEDQTDPIFGMDRTLEECQALLKEVEQAAAKNDLPQAELYFQTKQELLTKEIDFHRGGWVNLNFTPDMRHWRNLGGRYQVESPTSLLAANSDREKQYLFYNTSFPVPYQVELKVESLKWHYSGKSLPAGLMFGEMFNAKTGMLFWVDTFRKKLGFARPGAAIPGYGLEVDKTARLKITIHKDGHFRMFDGVKNTRKYQREDFQPGLIGLGIVTWFKYSGEVRYSDMRIRKVAPSDNQPEDQVTYYSQLLEKKETYDSYLSLGIAYENLKKYEKAVDAFVAAEKIRPTAALPAQHAAFTLSQLKRHQEARQAMERGLKKSVGEEAKHRPLLLQYLALFYATREAEFRDGDKAIAYAEELLTLTKEGSRTWQELSAVAAAYAEAGDFENSVKYGKLAITKAKDSEQLPEVQEKLKLYEDGKRFYEK